jgi:hypothetical protein
VYALPVHGPGCGEKLGICCERDLGKSRGVAKAVEIARRECREPDDRFRLIGLDWFSSYQPLGRKGKGPTRDGLIAAGAAGSFQVDTG